MNAYPDTNHTCITGCKAKKRNYSITKSLNPPITKSPNPSMPTQ